MLFIHESYWKLKKHGFEYIIDYTNYLFALCPLGHTQKNETEEMHFGKTWILWYGKQNKTKENKIKKKKRKKKQKQRRQNKTK